jgi:hypothetical protein
MNLILILLATVVAGLLMWLVVEITLANYRLGFKSEAEREASVGPLWFALQSMDSDSAMPAKPVNAEANSRSSQATPVSMIGT